MFLELSDPATIMHNSDGFIQKNVLSQHIFLYYSDRSFNVQTKLASSVLDSNWNNWNHVIPIILSIFLTVSSKKIFPPMCSPAIFRGRRSLTTTWKGPGGAAKPVRGLLALLVKTLRCIVEVCQLSNLYLPLSYLKILSGYSSGKFSP